MLKTNLAAAFLTLSILVFTSAMPAKDQLAEDVLKYTNQFRKSKGLASLEMRSDLSEVARKHSEDMANGRRSFGHGGYDQRVIKVRKLMRSSGCSVAENVAYGANTAKEAFTIWKNSSGHRSNMLGDYKYTGIGVARNKRGVIYYTQIFVK